MNNDDFYIGYLPKAPESVGRFTKKVVISLLSGAALIAVLLVIAQQAFYPSTFEFLQYKTFTGTFHSHPYPMLKLLQNEEGETLPAYRHYYLVNEGKFGTQDLAPEFDGRRVELEGTLIYRDDQTMIEIKAGTLRAIDDAAPSNASTPVSLGTFTMNGEIVDSKCFLGVMNPASHKPHRACATRCISGGIPPMFVVRDTQGKTSYFLLEGEDGSAVNKQVLDIVAEPLTITGEVFQLDDVLTLKADPTSYVRLTH